MRRWKEIVISGTVLAVVGLLVSLLASPPGVWKASIEGWFKVVWPIGGYAIFLGAGCLAGYGFSSRYSPIGHGAQLLDDEEYRREFRNCLKKHEFTLIKVFGYTGEVVTNDLIEYSDRYKAELEVRLLQRNWIIEEKDEIEHNQRPEARGLREWKKSQTIKRMAFEAWPHSMKRTIRYYSHHPILKGAILSSSKHEDVIAFVGLLKWDPLPASGGSCFKSVPGYVLMIRSSAGQSAKDMIERIQSQFEYDWRYGLSAAELASQQAQASPKSSEENQGPSTGDQISGSSASK